MYHTSLARLHMYRFFPLHTHIANGKWQIEREQRIYNWLRHFGTLNFTNSTCFHDTTDHDYDLKRTVNELEVAGDAVCLWHARSISKIIKWWIRSVSWTNHIHSFIVTLCSHQMKLREIEKVNSQFTVKLRIFCETWKKCKNCITWLSRCLMAHIVWYICVVWVNFTRSQQPADSPHPDAVKKYRM